MKKEIKLSKRGVVTIPSKFREKMKIKIGEWVDVFKKSNGFIIQCHEKESTYNTMVVGNGGTVRIPSEITKQLQLEPNNRFEVTIINDKKIEFKLVI